MIRTGHGMKNGEILRVVRAFETYSVRPGSAENDSGYHEMDHEHGEANFYVANADGAVRDPAYHAMRIATVAIIENNGARGNGNERDALLVGIAL